MRRGVYDHLLQLDLAFFGRTRMGQIVSRLTHDVEQLRTLVTRELSRSVSSFFEFVAAVVFMVAISWKLTWPRSWSCRSPWASGVRWSASSAGATAASSTSPER